MGFDSGFVGNSDMDSIGSMLTDPIAKIEQFFGANGQKMPDPTSAGSSQNRTLTTAKTLQTVGLFTTVLGGINSAVGSYFAAKSTQYQEKSQALNLDYQADMAAINARSAEYTAQSDLEAGKSQIFNQTLQAGQQKASATASMTWLSSAPSRWMREELTSANMTANTEGMMTARMARATTVSMMLNPSSRLVRRPPLVI